MQIAGFFFLVVVGIRADGYSTVYKQARKKDIHGQPFRANFRKYETVGNLTNYQLNRLKKFVKKK